MASNFLELPAELRNKVYEMALLYKDPIAPMLTAGTNQGRCLYQTPLLRASKVISRETASMFYSQNCFDLTKLKFAAIPVFLNMIGRVNASRIRHIRIHFPCSLKGPIFIPSVREFCTNLRTITVTAATIDRFVFFHQCLHHLFSITQILQDGDDRMRSCGHHPGMKIEVEVHNQQCDSIDLIVDSFGWDVKFVGPFEFSHLLEYDPKADGGDQEDDSRSEEDSWESEEDDWYSE